MVAAKEDIAVHRALLPNGLRFVHHAMPDSAMVALNVMYNTGARDESPDLTGIAHLFEHIMFGGSANVADFDGLLTAAGGVSNAWTSNDFTNFFQIAPAHNAETLFYLESDRMLAPSLTDEALEVQRAVVIEEFKQQCLNRPYGDMSHFLRPAVYGSHPYSWPVIGKDFESIGRMTRHDVVRWWTDHYSPDNAVLSVAGNIDFDRAYALALMYFGEIPARATVPRNFAPIADIAAAPPRMVHGNVPATMITVAWLMDPYGTLDYAAADAITDVLGAGHASRFAERINMVPSSPLVAADASITGSEHPGMLILSARLANESVDIDMATKLLIDTACSVFNEGVTEHELERLKNRQRSLFVMSNLDCITCAQTIAEAEMHGVNPGKRLEIYNKLTTADIERVARSVMRDSAPVVIYYRPA